MKKLLIIGGSTGSGKSGVAVECAKLINAEIISSDSMQIYRKMNIGTAKVTEEEIGGIPHHLLDIVEPNVPYSVCDYKRDALAVINDIWSRGKDCIVVGGTGLYINSLIYDLSFSGEKNEELREKLKTELEQFGKEYMHDKLRKLSPESADRLHVNDTKRVLRAIEKALTGGGEESDMNKPFLPYKMYVLDTPRDVLYNKINARVDEMIKNGLYGEVQALLADGVNYDTQSMQAIAYKEWALLNEGATEDEIIELIKKNTRNYAKRQVTWFKQYKDAVHVEAFNRSKKEIANEIINDYLKMENING